MPRRMTIRIWNRPLMRIAAKVSGVGSLSRSAGYHGRVSGADRVFHVEIVQVPDVTLFAAQATYLVPGVDERAGNGRTEKSGGTGHQDGRSVPRVHG